MEKLLLDQETLQPDQLKKVTSAKVFTSNKIPSTQVLVRLSIFIKCIGDPFKETGGAVMRT